MALAPEALQFSSFFRLLSRAPLCASRRFRFPRSRRLVHISRGTRDSHDLRKAVPLSPPVAYPGPPGSHTASAAAALHPAEQLVPLAGFRAVADAVVSAEVGHGVLPIESSLAGPVAETHDLLYERALSIVGETVLPIRHCLAASAAVPLDEIRVVRSHPTAFDQCRDLLARLPQASVIAASTTADAGAAGGRGRRPDRGGDRQPRGGRDLRADGARRRRQRQSGVHALRVDRAVHAHRPGARRRARRSRSRPITGRVRCSRRSSRSRARGSISCASCRGRCRRRRGSTASTRSSSGIRSTRRCVSRCGNWRR